MTRADRSGPGRWAATLSLALLALSAGASGLGNQFTQDDLPLVLRNETVHTLSDPVRIFTQPYWHDPFPPSLYRPLSTATLGVEWAVGRGRPAAFRWGSLVLLIAVTVALFGLASRLLPGPWPWTIGALFAVHPVHVEALAPAVNQGELAVGLLALLAAGRYIRDRRAGSVGATTIAVVGLATLAASLFKENGLILPGLLFAAELTLLRTAGPQIPSGGTALRRLWLVLALLLAVVLGMRARVLEGVAIGAPPAEALSGAGLGGRVLTMLAVVPEFVRLLFWPAHLQADYGPNEIAAAGGWGAAQFAGSAILLTWAGLILVLRRRRPAIAFGLLWMAVALLPVGNVLIPTGIVLAERTLFLASCGAMLALGGALAALEEAAPPRAALPVRRGALGLAAGLIVLGGIRSATRLRDWRDQGTLLRRTVADAPRSYAAHLAYSRFLEDSADGRGALDHFRQAVALKPALPAQERFLADQYRSEGLCDPAVRRYRRLLALEPANLALRGALVDCLLRLGAFGPAREEAVAAGRYPAAGPFFERAIRTADSGLAASGLPRGSAGRPTDFDSAHAKP